MKVMVTGCSGSFGQWVVKELQANGHSVVGADKIPSQKISCPFLIVDFMNPGEVYSALYEERPDAIINLAAIPRPGILSARATFLTNVEILYNVLEAAVALRIKKIAHASTDSSYGFVFAKHHIIPQYLPVDEDHPQLPQDCYGGSKVLNEHTARIFARANPGLQVTCIRICGLIDPETPPFFLPYNDTLEGAGRNERGLFSYINMRDAAAGFRLAVEKDLPGFDVFHIIAKDTLTSVETTRLIARYFPNVEIRREFKGNEALFSSEKATRVLGWNQRYSWRDMV